MEVGVEIRENGLQSTDPGLNYFRNMNREELIIYLEENLGDDPQIDPERIRNLGDAEVEEYKRILLKELTKPGGQEQGGEENVVNGSDNMVEGEDEVFMTNNMEMSRQDSNNNKGSSSASMTASTLSSSGSSPNKRERLEAESHVNQHQNIVLKQPTTGVGEKEILVITLSDSEDDDGGGGDQNDANQKNNDADNQQLENEDETNLDNFSVSANADSPRPSLHQETDNLAICTELVVTSQKREAAADKIARWSQANSRELFYPINSVLVPENEEAEFNMEVDDTTNDNDDVDPSFFGESSNNFKKPRSDADPDDVYAGCGAALLPAKIRITDGVRPWLNIQDDDLQNIFEDQPCYEKQNFKTKCNLCNEFIRGKKNLAEHVTSGTHRRSLMNLSLKLIGMVSIPSAPTLLKTSEEKINLPEPSASSIDCKKNDNDQKDANSKDSAAEPAKASNKNIEGSKKSIAENGKPHISQTGIKFNIKPLKSKLKLDLASTLRSSKEDSTRAPTWKRRGGKGLPVGIVSKSNSENAENTTAAKRGSPEGSSKRSDLKSQLSDRPSKHRSTYRSRSRSRERRSRSRSKGKRSRTLSSSSRRRKDRRRSSSSRERRRSSSRKRRRSSSSGDRRRSRSKSRTRRSRSKSRTRRSRSKSRTRRSRSKLRTRRSRSKSIQKPTKSKSPDTSKDGPEPTVKQPPSSCSHPPMICTISCEQIFLGPDTTQTEGQILKEKIALINSSKWNSELADGFKGMVEEREELKQVFTQASPVMIEKLQKHPVYEKEWHIFWTKRYKQLIVEEGKTIEFATAYDFTEEWNVEWSRIVLEILQKKYDQKLQDIRKKYKVDLDSLVQLNAAAAADTNVKSYGQVIEKDEDKNNSPDVIFDPPTSSSSSEAPSNPMMPPPMPPPPPPPPPAESYFGLIPTAFSPVSSTTTTNNGSTLQSVTTI